MTRTRRSRRGRSNSPPQHLTPDGRGFRAVPNEANPPASSNRTRSKSTPPTAENTDQNREHLDESQTNRNHQNSAFHTPTAPPPEEDSDSSTAEGSYNPDHSDGAAHRNRQLQVSRRRGEEQGWTEDILHDLDEEERRLLDQTTRHTGLNLNLNVSQGETPLGRQYWQPDPQPEAVPENNELNKSVGAPVQFQYVPGYSPERGEPTDEPDHPGPPYTSSPIHTTANRRGDTEDSGVPPKRHSRSPSGNRGDGDNNESAWITNDYTKSQDKSKQAILHDVDTGRGIASTRYYTGSNVDRHSPPPSYVSEQRIGNRNRERTSPDIPVSPITKPTNNMENDPPPSPIHPTGGHGLYPELDLGIPYGDEFTIQNFEYPGNPQEAAEDDLARRVHRPASPPHRFISGVSIEAAKQFARDIKDNNLFDNREKTHIANIIEAAQDGNTSIEYEEKHINETFYPYRLRHGQTISTIAVPNIDGVSFTKDSTPLIEKYYQHSLDLLKQEEKQLERLLTKRDETMLQLKYYNRMMAVEMAKKKSTIRIALVYYYHNMIITLAMRETLYTFAILQHFRPQKQEMEMDHKVRLDAFGPLQNCWRAASKFIKSCRLQHPTAGKHIHPLSELPSIIPFWQIPPDSMETDHLDYPYHNKVKAAQMTYLHLELQRNKPMSYLRKLIKKVFTHEAAQDFLDLEFVADNSSHRKNRQVLEVIGNQLDQLVRDTFSYSLDNTNYKNFLNRLVRAPFTLANLNSFVDQVQTNADFRQLVAATYRQVKGNKKSSKDEIRKVTSQFAEVAKYLKSVGYQLHGQEVASYQDVLHDFNKNEYYDEWTRSTKDQSKVPQLGSLEAAMKKAREDALARERQRLEIAQRKKRVFKANDIPVDQKLEEEIQDAVEAVRHREETINDETKRDSHFYKTCLSTFHVPDQDESDHKPHHSTFRPVFESTDSKASKGAGGSRPPSPKNSGTAADDKIKKDAIYHTSAALPHSQKVYYGHQGKPEESLYNILKPKPDASESERIAFMLMKSVMMPRELKFRCRKFDGDPLQWIDFWEAFTGLIDIHPNKTELEKFMELNSLLSHKVRQKISHLKTVPENYQKAKDILCREYGRLDYIVNAAVKQYDQVPKLPDEPKLEELEEFFNKTSTLIQLVQKHNKDLLYNRFLLNKIEARLHKRFFFKWRKILKKLYEHLDFSEQRLDDAAYEAFLHHFQIEIEDTKEQQRYNRDPLKNYPYKHKTSFKTSKSYAAAISTPSRTAYNNSNNNINKSKPWPKTQDSRSSSRPPLRTNPNLNNIQRPRSNSFGPQKNNDRNRSTDRNRFSDRNRSSSRNRMNDKRTRSISRPKQTTATNAKFTDKNRTIPPCVFCKKYHDLSNCPNTNPGQRMVILRSEKRCHKCFRIHSTLNCTSNVTCKVCRSKNHHTALHIGKPRN